MPRKSATLFLTPGLSRLIVNFLLFCSGVFYFSFSHPNIFSDNGFPLLAYGALIPVFILIRRISLPASCIWGGLYGLLSYGLFSSWLTAFHPLALYIITIQYFIYFLIVFLLLKLADDFFPKYGFIVQWMVWVGFEYVKTLGFVGYSYGIIGYSQWSLTAIIQAASFCGVWGVSALVVFPSAWIAGGLKAGCMSSFKTTWTGFKIFAGRHKISGLLWLGFFTANLIAGSGALQDYSGQPSFKIALIQPNNDPWHGGLTEYWRNFRTLTRLSDQALRENPDLDLVVWPETAFIPRIDWHYRYREDQDVYELVSALLSYINSAPVPFVLGNDDAILGLTEDGTRDRIDYNAALLFTPGISVIPPNPVRYRKMHLVPFTEHFPFKKQLPFIHDLLIRFDTHFWTKGTEPVVFSVGPLSFSTPICFEDTFGYISRRFVQKGARAIINMSNDAWSQSRVSQYQHLSMAVFRAVENRVPMVRSTASGQTCVIDPNGKVSDMARPFTETVLVASIPLITQKKPTFYTVWGDFCGILFAAGAAIALGVGMLTKIRHLYDN